MGRADQRRQKTRRSIAAKTRNANLLKTKTASTKRFVGSTAPMAKVNIYFCRQTACGLLNQQSGVASIDAIDGPAGTSTLTIGEYADAA